MTPGVFLARDERARTLAIRVLCLAIAAASAAALILVSAPQAQASGSGDSSVTVAWTGDTSVDAADQPDRHEATNPHYASLKNITATVNRTEGVGDQALSVSITGFAGTRAATDSSGAVYTNAMNFMQAMQCWGDPSSATFNETCQWGGLYGPNNGVGNTVYPDNLLRVSTTDIQARATTKPATVDPNDVPFELNDGAGTLVTGHQTFVPDPVTGKDTDVTQYPLFDYLSPATTNEVPSARMNSDGTGSFDFETQNTDNAPQSSCGAAGHLVCYLVLVPRDAIYGGKDSSCSQVQRGFINSDGDSDARPYTYGEANAIQAGSPVNPACDYWQNRMVIPLTFAPTGSSCPAGAVERDVTGSELVVGAMASWQPAVCTAQNTVFSFATNPDAVARAQLIEGQTGLSFSSEPLSAAELSDQDATTLAASQVSYAPVAVTSAVFAFQAEGSSGRITSLVLSPRLVAKLLTQSYIFTVPSNSSDPTSNFLHLPTVNRTYQQWNEDPDFKALNPNWKQFNTNPEVILPGPNSADVIAQLWKWIDADTDARDFLDGKADPWGMTVNPYYLPKGDPNATVPLFDNKGVLTGKNAAVGLTNLDGTPLSIGEVPQNSFIKADQSLVPLDIVDGLAQQGIRYQFGSTQSDPYADTFLQGARSAFRADDGAKTVWDPTQVDPAGDKGAWVDGGAQIPGQRFTIAFTDEASAARYDLSTAALTIDNQPTVSQAPTDAALTAALSTALTVTANPAVSQVDPTKVVAGAYPLTNVVYADVDLTGSTTAARTDYAHFLTQVTTTGQEPGVEFGQLPPGYVPLTSGQQSQAAAAAAAMVAYVSPTTAPDSGTNEGFDGGSTTTDPSTDTGTGSPAGSQSVSTVTASAVHKTPTSPAGPLGQGALWGSLGIGVAGAIFSPVFLRRRRIL